VSASAARASASTGVGVRFLAVALVLGEGCSANSVSQQHVQPAPARSAALGGPETAHKHISEHGPHAVPLLHPRLSEAWLGVELERGNGGVQVTRVVPSSPAERAGLLVGDELLSLNRQLTRTPRDLSERVAELGLNERISLSRERGGSRLEIGVDLEAAPHPEDRLRLLLMNQPAPEISGIVSFQGDVASLGDASGQVFVVEFWASYCPPCRKIAEILQSTYDELRPRGLVVLGITGDVPLRAAEVAQERNMRYPLASDTSAKVAQAYFAREVPMVVLVDRRGIVRDVFLGYDPERISDLRRQIDLLLGEVP
jgi:peroxiredoxin